MQSSQRILLKLRNVMHRTARALRRQNEIASSPVDFQLQFTILCDRICGARIGFPVKRGERLGRNGNGRELHYSAVNKSDVPQGRKGKHRKAVSDILGDLSKLKPEEAVKIPLSSLNGEKMQNLRSALNRVTREKNIPVVTSSDEKYLYVWKADSSAKAIASE